MPSREQRDGSEERQFGTPDGVPDGVARSTGRSPSNQRPLSIQNESHRGEVSRA